MEDSYRLLYVQSASHTVPITRTLLPSRAELPPASTRTPHSDSHQEAHNVGKPDFQTPSSSTPIPESSPTTRAPTKAHAATYYTFDDGPRTVPGTALYYRTDAFRKKLNSGLATILGRDDDEDTDADFDADNSTDKDHDEQSEQANQAVKRKSLVMVFSRTSVRRAGARWKVDKRAQRANRRLYVFAGLLEESRLTRT